MCIRDSNCQGSPTARRSLTARNTPRASGGLSASHRHDVPRIGAEGERMIRLNASRLGCLVRLQSTSRPP
eukprot:14813717-Alexandrium_andersonii.AAC.1